MERPSRSQFHRARRCSPPPRPGRARRGLSARRATGAPVQAAAQAARHRPRRRDPARLGAGPAGGRQRRYFTETGTRWIRMWADWPSLQPSADHAPDDPLTPAALQAARARRADRARERARDPRPADALPLPALGQRHGGRRARRAGRRPSTGCNRAPTDRTARGRGSSPSCTTATTLAASPARGGRRLRARQRAQPPAVAAAGRRARGRAAAQDRAGDLRPQRALDDALRALDLRRRRAERSERSRAGTSSCQRCWTSWRRSATCRTPGRRGRTTTTPTSSGARRRRAARRSGRC